MNGVEGSTNPHQRASVRGDLNLNYVWNCTNCTGASTPTYVFGGCSAAQPGADRGSIDWIGSTQSGSYLVQGSASRVGCWIDITRQVTGPGGSDTTTFYFAWTAPPAPTPSPTPTAAGPCTTPVDEAGYLALYSDIRDAGINPWLHYKRFGHNEGRCPLTVGSCHITVSESEYLELYDDLTRAGITTADGARDHYKQFGASEGRCPLFYYMSGGAN